MTDPAGETLSGNILRTVATAEAVLDHFERSLIESGFAEGADSYRRLADTLLGQRLWVESSGQPADARFHAVGRHAQAIHAMLAPYTQAFLRLSALAAPDLGHAPHSTSAPAAEHGSVATGSETNSETRSATGTPDTVDDSDEVVLKVLRDAGRPMSATALRAASSLSRKDLLATLDRLAASDLVSRRHTGGRELIEVTS
jgi:hypothetical protein